MSVPRLRARLHSQAARCAQVHRATLHDGRKVVLKIQYPGVARSIESDVDNLLRLISYANILPKGLYVEAAAKARAHFPLHALVPWQQQTTSAPACAGPPLH